MSPYKVKASVLGMGVADIARMCGAMYAIFSSELTSWLKLLSLNLENSYHT
jgi:hypothetical protein